ncbi:lytic transglycosylase domain-containing protein [Abyssibacter sp.]|jgi:soluble lytic murein transglycosylase-like protein|uniref:lytic transglycosylase domain-containing protein n=1 Tax=Abyssibacter sp. TaxID=2320200 RepID=UPI0025B96EFF|nr:lytic transglycosylase domain-containing protein [Abyssibacter sp.]
MPCWPRLATSGLLAAALAGGAAQAQVLEPDPGVRAALMDAVSEADSFEHPFDAEVWLLDMSTRLTAYNAAYDDGLDILRVAHREALRAELPPELVLAVIDIESRFDKFAISHAGALGLMQIMPFWLDEIGRPNDNLFQVETNLRYGCAILKHYLDRENGDLTRALARYNGSLGKTWYPERVLEALSSRWYQR